MFKYFVFALFLLNCHCKTPRDSRMFAAYDPWTGRVLPAAPYIYQPRFPLGTFPSDVQQQQFLYQQQGNRQLSFEFDPLALTGHEGRDLVKNIAPKHHEQPSQISKPQNKAEEIVIPWDLIVNSQKEQPAQDTKHNQEKVEEPVILDLMVNSQKAQPVQDTKQNQEKAEEVVIPWDVIIGSQNQQSHQIPKTQEKAEDKIIPWDEIANPQPAEARKYFSTEGGSRVSQKTYETFKDILAHFGAKKISESIEKLRTDQEPSSDSEARFLGTFGSFFALPERFRQNQVQLYNNPPQRSTLTFLSTILTSTSVRVPQVCLVSGALGVCRRRRGLVEEEPEYVSVNGKEVRPSEVLSLIPTEKPTFVEPSEDKSSEHFTGGPGIQSSKVDLEDSSEREARFTKDLYEAQVLYTVTSFITVTQTFSVTGGSLYKVSVATACIPSCLLSLPFCPA